MSENQPHHESKQTPAPASFAEMVAALKTLNTPAPDGIGKHIATIVVAAILGLGVYVVSGVSGMQSSIATIQATTTQSKTTLDTMQTDIKELGTQQNDLRTQVAKLEQRMTALENQKVP